MGKKRLVNIHWPLGGLDQGGPYSGQPPFTTPDCLNVRGQGALEGRFRGGSRMGLVKGYYDQLGSGNPVNLLSEVTTVGVDTNGNYLHYVADSFDSEDGTLGSGWSTASWIGSAPSVSGSEYDGYTTTGSGEVGAVRTARGFLTSQDYYIEIEILPFQGTHHGTYKIFGRMGNSTPDATADGITASLTLSGSNATYSGSLVDIASSSTVSTTAFTGGNLGANLPVKFRVQVSGDDITCSINGTALHTTKTVTSHTDSSVGFSITPTGNLPDDVCIVDSFATVGKADTTAGMIYRTHQSTLVAASNGTLYTEDTPGQLTALAGNVQPAADLALQAVSYNQKLYIADHEPIRVEGTDGTVTSGVLTATGVSDWSAEGVDPDNDVVVIYGHATATQDATYKITSVAAGNLTITATAPTDGSCSYRVVRGPKVYTPSTGALALLFDTGSGDVPSGCPLITVYKDALVMAGSESDPHLAYIGTPGDPTDWDFGSDVSNGRPMVIGGSDAGQIGQPINALIPFSDDYLIFGCTSSLWILRGDPRLGGTLDALSYDYGCVFRNAWCELPNGDIMFLSHYGLGVVRRGAYQTPEIFSKTKLPALLQNVDATQAECHMAWDPKQRGVSVLITSRDSGRRYSYFVDIQSGNAVWRDQYPATMEPSSILYYQTPLTTYHEVMIGCQDGYIRKWSALADMDDGTAIASHIYVGPIKMGGNDARDGTLMEIISSIAKDAGDVDWELYAGETVEDAQKGAASFASGTWSREDGLQYTVRPLLRGHSFFIKISNNQDERWAMERLSAVYTENGPQNIIGD